MKDFLSYYNDMLNTEGTHINRSVFDGFNREGKLHKGITTLLKEHLINVGAWEDYLGFNRVFNKIKQALSNVDRKLKVAYGKQ